MTANVVRFKKPFKLARREDVDPGIVTEWIIQAGLWANDPDATDQQLDLASAVIEQWGME